MVVRCVFTAGSCQTRGSVLSAHLQEILALHFDEQHGSPYWLEKQQDLDFDVVATIQTLDDLPRLGPFDLDALRTRPYTDFLPQRLHHELPLIFAETGGATGTPATTAYTEADFTAAFVQPFLDRVVGDDLFAGGHWLWLGPGGPHIIGKAAQRIAQLTTGCDAFSIDFDPRWFRRLAPASMARQRYFEHVLEQTLRIVNQQDVRYLFCTPVVLRDLLLRMTGIQKDKISFVYLGGMAIESSDMAAFAQQLPAAKFLSGYGNTLFGVTHEAAIAAPSDDIRHYYPTTARLQLRIVEPPSQQVAATERLWRDVDYGARGQVVMSRLDESAFLPNVFERDDALCLAPLDPQSRPGIGDPRPPSRSQLTIDNGIY